MFKRAVAVEYLQTGVPRTEIAMKYGLPNVQLVSTRVSNCLTPLEIQTKCVNLPRINISEFEMTEKESTPNTVLVAVVMLAPTLLADDAIRLIDAIELLVHLADILKDGAFRPHRQHAARLEALVHLRLQLLARKLPTRAQTLVDNQLPSAQSIWRGSLRND